ncbi:MAG: helix-turn-helix transcriptional regulator [Actinomycetota bacterium]|nr:helix-turn-helix transcriptional regulator [Actinomycetota bacterium]
MVLRNRLRELRYSHGDVSQTQLAKDLSVSRQTINSLENGRYYPSILLALQIAHHFGVPVEQVFWMEADDEN